MRNISFSLTTAQVKDRTKTVTRRLGWNGLKPGDRLQAVEKAMGLKRGEKVVKLCIIEVVSVRQEPLNMISDEDVLLEGFPGKTKEWFVLFFCLHNGGGPLCPVSRIEFKYLDSI